MVRMFFKISVDTLCLVVVEEVTFCDLIIVHRLCLALARLLPVFEEIAVIPVDQMTSVFLSHFGSLLGCFLTVSSMLWDAWLTFLTGFNLAVCGDMLISFHRKQNCCGTKMLVSIVKTLLIYIIIFEVMKDH